MWYESNVRKKVIFVIKKVKILSLICVLCMMCCACAGDTYKSDKDFDIGDILGDNDIDMVDVIEELEDSVILDEVVEDFGDLEVEYTAPETVYNSNDSYKQIAVFGIPSNNVWSDKGNRSEEIMVLTINENTGNVDIVSIQNYTYLNVCDDIYSRANLAYSKGGASEAINMLNRNFDFNVTDCITIGFDGVISLVDSLGGAWVDVDEKELEAMNGNTNRGITDEMENDLKPLKTTGKQLLDGTQTATYCLGRLYSATNSVWVAQRQQEVFLDVINHMQDLDDSSIDTINKNLYENYIYTSLSYDEYEEIVDIVLKNGVNKTLIAPKDDLSQSLTMSSHGSCMCPVDLTQNVQWLHKELFGKMDYQPSETVKEISKQVSEDMKEYQ